MSKKSMLRDLFGKSKNNNKSAAKLANKVEAKPQPKAPAKPQPKAAPAPKPVEKVAPAPKPIEKVAPAPKPVEKTALKPVEKVAPTLKPVEKEAPATVKSEMAATAAASPAMDIETILNEEPAAIVDNAILNVAAKSPEDAEPEAEIPLPKQTLQEKAEELKTAQESSVVEFKKKEEASNAEYTQQLNRVLSEEPKDSVESTWNPNQAVAKTMQTPDPVEHVEEVHMFKQAGEVPSPRETGDAIEKGTNIWEFARNLKTLEEIGQFLNTFTARIHKADTDSFNRLFNCLVNGEDRVLHARNIYTCSIATMASEELPKLAINPQGYVSAITKRILALPEIPRDLAQEFISANSTLLSIFE